MDPDHRRCFRHPEDDEEKIEIVDEAPDELDEQVMKDEAEWTPPEFGDVSEDAAMEAKQEAAEAVSSATSRARWRATRRCSRARRRR